MQSKLKAIDIFVGDYLNELMRKNLPTLSVLTDITAKSEKLFKASNGVFAVEVYSRTHSKTNTFTVYGSFSTVEFDDNWLDDKLNFASEELEEKLIAYFIKFKINHEINGSIVSLYNGSLIDGNTNIKIYEASEYLIKDDNGAVGDLINKEITLAVISLLSIFDVYNQVIFCQESCESQILYNKLGYLLGIETGLDDMYVSNHPLANVFTGLRSEES